MVCAVVFQYIHFEARKSARKRIFFVVVYTATNVRTSIEFMHGGSSILRATTVELHEAAMVTSHIGTKAFGKFFFSHVRNASTRSLRVVDALLESTIHERVLFSRFPWRRHMDITQSRP